MVDSAFLLTARSCFTVTGKIVLQIWDVSKPSLAEPVALNQTRKGCMVQPGAASENLNRFCARGQRLATKAKINHDLVNVFGSHRLNSVRTFSNCRSILCSEPRHKCADDG